MFYSHEILTSRQHGVATIWLIATVGPRGGTRKFTRKAIQEVDVKRACQTIIEPGAPLALRLQGNLLYGVSCVYSQQCKYVLTDASKVQQDMMLFYQVLARNATDPDAGKAAREQNILGDDPNFVLEANIPHFDFDLDGNARFMASQLSSRNGYSQLSPMDSVDSSGRRSASILSYNMSHSDLASLHLPTPLAHKSGKKTTLQEAKVEQEQEVNDMDALGDIELEIDADGNILGVLDPFAEPDLPALLFPDRHEDVMGVDRPAHADQDHQGHIREDGEHQPIFDGDGDIPMMDDAPVLAVEDIQQEGQEQEQQAPSNAVPASKAPVAKKRKTHNINPDVVTNHSIPTLRTWQNDYLERNLEEAAANFPPKVSIADARVNAFHLTFGQGIAGVGLPNGVAGFEHPLAQLFAGGALKDMVLGIEVGGASGSEDGHRRRRSASQAFSEHDIEDARRVRPRLNESPRPDDDACDNNVQQGNDDMALFFGDGAAPEEARKEQADVDDRLSSSLMPWNRTPSVHRPSSVIGSKQRPGSHHGAESPGNSTVPPIERYSDAPGAPSSELGFGAAPSVHSDFEEFGPAAFVTTQEAQDSQWMHSALDQASNEFLDYVNEQAKKTGGYLEGDTDGRLWIEFEELAPPGKHPKIVAAQAFLHVLTLATKEAIKVDQDVENNQPFGTIHIGTMVDLEMEDCTQTETEGED